MNWYGDGTQKAVDDIFADELATIVKEKVEMGSSVELEQRVF